MGRCVASCPARRSQGSGPGAGAGAAAGRAALEPQRRQLQAYPPPLGTAPSRRRPLPALPHQRPPPPPPQVAAGQDVLKSSAVELLAACQEKLHPGINKALADAGMPYVVKQQEGGKVMGGRRQCRLGMGGWGNGEKEGRRAGGLGLRGLPNSGARPAACSCRVAGWPLRAPLRMLPGAKRQACTRLGRPPPTPPPPQPLAGAQARPSRCSRRCARAASGGCWRWWARSARAPTSRTARCTGARGAGGLGGWGAGHGPAAQGLRPARPGRCCQRAD
jgi:hypothetical protein